MKLDRNINGTGRGKYGLILNRKLALAADTAAGADVNEAICILEAAGIIEWGEEGTASEFFVVKLRDQYAGSTLSVYGTMATHDDPEYGHDVLRLADRAGSRSPFCKKPD